MSLTFKQLSKTNAERCKEWMRESHGEAVDLLYHSNELGDECGEVQGAVKKMIRHWWGIPGGIPPVQSIEHIAEELADVVIVADLLANHLNIDLGQAITKKFNATSDKHSFQIKLPVDPNG